MSERQTFRELRLILGDQLNAGHSWYKSKDDDVLYLIAELNQEQQYVTHHVQKIQAFFAAMAQFAKSLKAAGHQVLWLSLDDTSEFETLPLLLTSIIDKYQSKHFAYQQPDEYRLSEQLKSFCQNSPLSTSCFETEHFFLSHTQLPQYFKADTHHVMEPFYRKMRKRFDYLMSDDKPLGGRWNFDHDNRKKLSPQDIEQLPQPLCFDNDVKQINERLARHNIAFIGHQPPRLLWPVNRTQAVDLLQHFCRICLPNFGRFQDAMTCQADDLLGDRQWSLYHSRLSFALNAKIISCRQVIDTAISAYQQNPDIDLAQIEGFVRQILGWREFVRGVYWANMPAYASSNHLEAKRALPQWFWHGNTMMNCLHRAIGQSLEYGYAHHIQRLMVTGNFCLIAGIDPDAVDNWYLGIYVDAIEWVEITNTRGMSQYADGGIIATRAYAASGNYINKMSDYCQSCHYDVKQKTGAKACPLNSLYWHFIDRHREKFSRNPRQALVYKNWDKRPEKERQQMLAHAEDLLKRLDEL